MTETQTKSYADMTVPELRKLAQGVISTRGARKADLVAALTEYDAKMAAARDKANAAEQPKPSRSLQRPRTPT
jgi:hypothetical protein